MRSDSASAHDSGDRDPATAGKDQTLSALAVTNVILGSLVAGCAAVFVYLEFVYEPEADPQLAQRYATEAKERLEKHSEAIQAEVSDLAAETMPVISEAVYAEVEDAYPEFIAAVQDEGDVYLANVEGIFMRKVKAQYREYLLAHRDVLKEEFPQHAGDENVEKVLKEFEQTVNVLIDRYYLDEFRRETKETVRLWKQIEPVPTPGPNEPSLNEQLADFAADWMVLRLSADPTAAGSAGAE